MKKILPFIIIIILIIGVGCGIVFMSFAKKYQPTSEFMDYAAELGLAEDEYSIMLNNERLTDEKAVSIDGRVYLKLDFVASQVNSRCYWDNNETLFLYALPEELLIFKPDETAYTVQTAEDEKQENMEYCVVRLHNDDYYIDGEFVKEHTQMNYDVYTEPNRIVLQTKWGEQKVVTAKGMTPIRYKGGIKSEVLRDAEQDEPLVLLEEYDDWSNVATKDGYVGWVKRKDLNEAETVSSEPPAFEAPEYTSITKDYKINMGWHQVMNKSANSSLNDVLNTTKGLNTISPTWFFFSDTDGKIDNIVTQDYVDQCHANGIEVWALFSNEFSDGEGSRVFDTSKTDEVLEYTSKRQKVIKELIKVIKQYNIDGINIDFELISQDGAASYIEFIRELSIACRANKIVLSVDNYVPKYTYYYNRKEQGIVADYVVIMGYDETTAGSDTAGPVASLDFVKEGIDDTLAVVDASKVINGIPFYTRVWSTNSEGGVSSFACGMNEALGYLTNHGVEPEFLDNSGLNYGSYTSDKDGNFYEIWLQDKTAVEEEMKLIKQYDLAGVAEWKIGFESGMEIWDIIDSYLK